MDVREGGPWCPPGMVGARNMLWYMGEGANMLGNIVRSDCLLLLLMLLLLQLLLLSQMASPLLLLSLTGYSGYK